MLNVVKLGPEWSCKGLLIARLTSPIYIYIYSLCEYSKARKLNIKTCTLCIKMKKDTYITIAEFFMMRPHGPNCWKGLGAFKERVRLQKSKLYILNSILR